MYIKIPSTVAHSWHLRKLAITLFLPSGIAFVEINSIASEPILFSNH